MAAEGLLSAAAVCDLLLLSIGVMAAEGLLRDPRLFEEVAAVLGRGEGGRGDVRRGEGGSGEDGGEGGERPELGRGGVAGVALECLALARVSPRA